jgi:hypothetical protein
MTAGFLRPLQEPQLVFGQGALGQRQQAQAIGLLLLLEGERRIVRHGVMTIA